MRLSSALRKSGWWGQPYEVSSVEKLSSGTRTPVNYSEALSYIGSLKKRGWRLGLDRMQEFLKRVGNPHEDLKFLHVAGTNGKGSVTAMLQSILTEAGYRTGGFYSPYVFDFRERIQINRELIPTEEVAGLTELLKPVSEKMEGTSLGGPTEFEFKTAMGFLFWKKMVCDYVCLEVGLGGRLDATNVVTPVISIITEIGLDHQQYLGETIEEIAGEKGGIIKPGIPCVCGATNPNAQKTIKEIAKDRNALFWQLGKEIVLEKANEHYRVFTPVSRHDGLYTNLLGSFQARNMAVAVGALDASGIVYSEKALIDGLKKVCLPGRMQVVCEEPFVLMDGAHNPQAAEQVMQSIEECFPEKKIRLVFSSSLGHNSRETLSAFSRKIKCLYLTTMENERSMGMEELLSVAREAGIEGTKTRQYSSPKEALAKACEDWQKGEIILVTGSFYLLSEALPALVPFKTDRKKKNEKVG